MNSHDERPAVAGARSARILVAEDSPVNLKLALKQLEKLGFEAAAVTDGAQVLDAMKQTTCDIVLMDCHMPEMSGYEAAWQVREWEREQAGQGRGEGPRAYIIAMTANAEADNREKCFAAGMDDFINKPVQLPELDAALHRALAERAAHQELDEVIDPAVIVGLRQLQMPGQPDPLAELIELFLQEAPGQLDALRHALAGTDAGGMARGIGLATALKGSASNLGARGLAALADEIVQTIKTGVLRDGLPLVEKAQVEFVRVRDALGKLKGQKRP